MTDDMRHYIDGQWVERADAQAALRAEDEGVVAGLVVGADAIGGFFAAEIVGLRFELVFFAAV